VARLRTVAENIPLVVVPQFEKDVHDLASLYETSRALWDEPRG
jgi:hypothetical protein